MPLDSDANPTYDKAKLPSRHVSVGPASAPHRSYYYAMGMTDREIANPFVGVATCWNEAAPCNISLARQAQVVKRGVKAAQGTPREFTTITVTDGIAMGHSGMKSSLVSRDLIADSVELTMRGHCYDALVGLAGCDKSLPGMMMAMVRLNVPAIFIYGGSILPGRHRGRDITVQDVFEAVGAHSAGKIDDVELRDIETAACPSAGSCGGQFTANTMACVSEAIGLALPGSAGAPAPYESRDAFCEASGRAVMDLLAQGIRPRDVVTRKSLENAARVVASSGGSTNAGLHLPAIAHEAGIEFDLHDVCEVFRSTPYIADLKPGGKYVAKDLYEVGGVGVIMKALLDGGYLHGDCITATGKTIAREPGRLQVPAGSGRCAPDLCTFNRDRRRGRAARQSGAGRGHREDRRPGHTEVPRPGALFRAGGRCLRLRSGTRLRGRRCLRHPQRRTQGRPRHARDAGDHRGTLWPRHRRQGGTDHRRPLFRCDARLLHRPCRPGGRGGRPHRPIEGRRHHRHRCHGRDHRGGIERRGTGRAEEILETRQPRFPVRCDLALCPDRGICPKKAP